MLDAGVIDWDMVVAVELIELNQTMALIYDHLSDQKTFGDWIRDRAEEKRKEKAAADGEGNE